MWRCEKLNHEEKKGFRKPSRIDDLNIMNFMKQENSLHFEQTTQSHDKEEDCAKMREKFEWMWMKENV